MAASSGRSGRLQSPPGARLAPRPEPGQRRREAAGETGRGRGGAGGTGPRQPAAAVWLGVVLCRRLPPAGLRFTTEDRLVLLIESDAETVVASCVPSASCSWTAAWNAGKQTLVQPLHSLHKCPYKQEIMLFTPLTEFSFPPGKLIKCYKN